MIIISLDVLDVHRYMAMKYITIPILFNVSHIHDILDIRRSIKYIWGCQNLLSKRISLIACAWIIAYIVSPGDLKREFADRQISKIFKLLERLHIISFLRRLLISREK